MPFLQCIDCHSTFDPTVRLYTCERCDGLLDLVYDVGAFAPEQLKQLWDVRLGSKAPADQSGVWRFRELLPEVETANIVTMLEGNTQLFDAPRCAQYAGLQRLTCKHLGMNPTGSFKDLGMTTGVTQAVRLEAASVACASTGNTSASMAAYAARAGMKAVIFIPSGQIALGKLSQALDYGATVVQIDGDFDDAMRLVRELTKDSPLYLLNSVNPFRLEGQKTIAFELLQQRDWRVPDRIVVPGGNLGNSSAIAKGLQELLTMGMIDRLPPITIIQAEGANPLYQLWQHHSSSPISNLQSPIPLVPLKGATTLATAIKIGNPVSWQKALRGLLASNGSVEQVSEQEIADAKAMIGRDGIGCEPASAVTLAGIKKLVAVGEIDPAEDIVAILTGHVLKDPDYVVNYHRGELSYTDKQGEKHLLASNYASQWMQVAAEREAIETALMA
ncbi:MAG TPA: threonine synthase [Blastocatellia bacterium]|nr:threonine synthase [Blastocatellia bacterium]